ncbi:MAG TPA: hypothetical protein VF591_13400 [Pyrinomonadaceae bacterium]|jgi:hypothetical protein
MTAEGLGTFSRAARRRLPRVFVALLVAALLAGAAEGSGRRVRFRRGQTKARVAGRLGGARDAAVFVARARRGQRMRVTVVRSAGPVRCVVGSPSGDEQGQPGTGTVFDEVLGETGLYRVRVTESPMGEPWRGPFLIEIEIK